VAASCNAARDEICNVKNQRPSTQTLQSSVQCSIIRFLFNNGLIIIIIIIIITNISSILPTIYVSMAVNNMHRQCVTRIGLLHVSATPATARIHENIYVGYNDHANEHLKDEWIGTMKTVMSMAIFV